MPSQYNGYFPFMDLNFMLSLGWVWRSRLTGWRAVMLSLFWAQIAAHTIYFYVSDPSRSFAYNYDLFLNLTFIGQCACVIVGARRAT